jgi:sporulation protein YlmC with PRC-barrel domain
MLKKLMITTAITGLMVGSALAEGVTSPAAKSDSLPAPSASTSSPEGSASPTMKSDSLPAPSASTSSTAGSVKFVNSQRPDQFLASKFKGTDVIGADEQKIGDVSDILFDKDGKVEAYVISVGGFLGMGSKEVALAPNAFQIVAGDKSKNESDKLKVSMTKEELKQAANFEPYKAPSSTTGMGSNSTSRPMGAPTRPAPATPAPAPEK